MNEGVDRKQLNLLKLKRLIDSGIASIPVDKKFNSTVLVIGDTGVGKTTILSFLAKRKLFIKIHGLNTILDSDDADGLKIGHDRFSETRVPSKIIIDKMVFFDCSGFKDNRGEEFEISNSFFVQRLFDIYANIKILLIIDESSVSEVRADKLPKLIRNLLKSFNTLVDIQDGVILLVNRAKPEFSQKAYGDELLKMAKLKSEDGFLFNEEERNFIEYLVKNRRICLFKQAQKQDEGKVLDVKQENLINLVRDTNFVKSKKIKNIISESAKLSIRDFIDRLAVDAEEKILKFGQEIAKQFSFKASEQHANRLEAARETKKRVAQFSQHLEKAKDDQIIDVIRNNLSIDLSGFEQDVSAVLFFKNIYNKSDFYFKLVRSNLSSSLTKLILNLDTEIGHLEEQEKIVRELKEQNEASKRKSEALERELRNLSSKSETYAKEAEQLKGLVMQQQDQKQKLVEKLKQAEAKLEQTTQKDSQKNQEVAELRAKLQNSINEIQELGKLLQNLRLENESNAEQIQLLQIENHSLKQQIQSVADNKSMAEDSLLNISKISKSSKYPEVVCPHFKNGGQCVHCIKKWKAEQKEKLKSLE